MVKKKWYDDDDASFTVMLSDAASVKLTLKWKSKKLGINGLDRFLKFVVNLYKTLALV